MKRKSHLNVVVAEADDSWQLQFRLNGKDVSLRVDPQNTLFEVLRNDLLFTGTKGACLEGECGSCTVLLDGEPVTSCLVLAPQVEGKEVITVEGLRGEDGGLHPVQKRFVDAGAVQCGFCTPGLVLSSVALLEKNATPSELEVREALEGNICRCTGYRKIIEAVLSASEGDEELSAFGRES